MFRGAPAALGANSEAGRRCIADGPDEVRLRVREQLFLRASHIKIVASGGVSSPRTTLDMLTLTDPELRVAVERPPTGTPIVAVHAYPPAAIQRAMMPGASASSTVT